jgi:hypothetical protein
MVNWPVSLGINLLSDSCRLVDVGCSLSQEDKSVIFQSHSSNKCVVSIVACFANARTVEARSLETGAQQKKTECL